MPELLMDVLMDAVIDTAKLIPFLLVTYIAMEALEHGTAGLSERIVRGAGRLGPLLGALVGVIPQCGFSAMAATLFSARVVGMGTLVAVILSTSDEMLPVFVAEGAPVGQIAAVMGIKVVVGIIVGFVIDVVVRSMGLDGDGRAHIHELCEREGCHCDDDHDHLPADDACACGHDHSHGHGEGGVVSSVLKSALSHTVQVTAFIFVISLALGFLMESVGEDNVAALVANHPIRSVMVAALVGLIPNCAASVFISELFMSGAIGTPAMLAGLLASGGVGLLVLFRTNADMRQNVFVVAVVWAAAVVTGLLASATGLAL